jgi:mycothiol system anti-sigma-R factor
MRSNQVSSAAAAGRRCHSRERKGSAVNCKDCADRLDRFVDRELNSTEVLELELHLESCPDCTEHYDFQVHLKRLVKHACECDAPPQAFRDKLRQLLT